MSQCTLSFYSVLIICVICVQIFLSTESSSKEYRDPKEETEEKEEKPLNLLPDSDDDDCGASSDHTKPDKSALQLDYIQQFLNKLGLKSTEEETDSDTHQVLKTLDFQGLIDHWKENGFKKIITMVGAGISTCK